MSESLLLDTAEKVKEDTDTHSVNLRDPSDQRHINELEEKGTNIPRSPKSVPAGVSDIPSPKSSPIIIASEVKPDSADFTAFIDSRHEMTDNPTTYMLDTGTSEQKNVEDSGSIVSFPPFTLMRRTSSTYSEQKRSISNSSKGTMLMRVEAKSAPMVSTSKDSVVFKSIKSAGTNDKNSCGQRLDDLRKYKFSDRLVQELTDDIDQDPNAPAERLNCDYTIAAKTPNTHFKSGDRQHWDSAILVKTYTENKNQTASAAAALHMDNLRRHMLHDAALRKISSHARSQSGVDIIKIGLSHSKFIHSKRLTSEGSKSDSKPLHFSQSYQALSRSKSLNNSTSGNVIGTCTDASIEEGRFQSLIEENDEDDDDDENIDSSVSPYNPITAETELNCLKPKQTPELQKPKVRAFLTALRPSFKNFYKGEDPESNKLSVKNIWNKQSGDLSGKLKRNERAQYITIWILFVLFIASLCIFIPLIIIYSGGTESTVKSYLSNIKPDDRDELLKDYIKKANVDSKPPRLLMRKLAFENKSLEPIIPDLSASIAGITSFSRLPEKYRNNSEIKSVMNNPALKNVFYGVDYAPKNVLYPMCGVSLHDVILDVALLSQVTSRIRTYETQCNQAKLILDSIKSLNLNVSLALGVWIGRDENINLHQINEMKEVLRSYPRQYFESLYIGNEVLFREEQTPSQLSTYIKEAKSFVTQELKWNLPVGTSDLGSKANLEVMEASDFFGSNAHPFLNGDNVQNATKWVYDFVNNNVELVKNKAMKKKPPGSNIDLIISEVGWPYDGGVFNGAVAGRGQMQSFLNDWICKSKQKNIPWFYFEAFDEPWKSIYHREDAKWETEWGIFTADRHLKDGIVFPDC